MQIGSLSKASRPLGIAPSSSRCDTANGSGGLFTDIEFSPQKHSCCAHSERSSCNLLVKRPVSTPAGLRIVRVDKPFGCFGVAPPMCESCLPPSVRSHATRKSGTDRDFIASSPEQGASSASACDCRVIEVCSNAKPHYQLTRRMRPICRHSFIPSPYNSRYPGFAFIDQGLPSSSFKIL